MKRRGVKLTVLELPPAEMAAAKVIYAEALRRAREVKRTPDGPHRVAA